MKTLKTIFLINLVLFASLKIQAQDIFSAVSNGDLSKVKELIEKDPDLVKARSPRKSTPLHLAAMIDSAEIAKYLIEKGADINAVRNDNYTPLILAGTKVTKLLIEKGADINYATPDGTTAIYYALENKDRNVFECLLDAGAKLPSPGTYGADRAIESAIRMGSMKFLETYLQKGAGIDFENNARMTLLHFAVESSSAELVSKLIALGAKVNKGDIYGWTPLHSASYKGNLRVVELLIQNGSDKNARTIDGKSPFNLAAEEKKDDVADYLKSLGADTSSPKLPVITGKYFGQRLPGKTPVPFVVPFPDIQKGFHGIFSFSPDGKSAYWKPDWNPYDPIHETKLIKKQWTKPVVSLFSARDQGDDAPYISPDGKRLFFLSQRPIVDGNMPFPYVEKIWVMDKTADGWSEPKKMPEAVNSVSYMHWQISSDLQGNLYFGAGGNIYCAGFKDGEYKAAEKLDITINNGKVINFSPCISPDGSYIIFSRQVPYFTYQLFLSFRKKDGTWSEPLNLSNYLKHFYSVDARVTPDGKYLFFSGRGGVVYWVDASFIEDLRPEE